MKLFLSFTIFLLCLLFNHVFSMNFNFTIEKVTLRCLAEYLTHSTLGKYKNIFTLVLSCYKNRIRFKRYTSTPIRS